MSWSLRNLLWMVPLGLMISSPLWKGTAAEFLQPRGGYDAAAEQATVSQSRQDFVMEDVVLAFTSDGEPTWTVHAEQARTGKSDRDIDMTDVHAVYSKHGDDPITVTSRTGSYQMDEKHLLLTGNVILVKPVQHEELHTELLHYYDQSKQLTTPEPVQINGPTFKLQGSSMEYDVSTKAYEFGGRVHAVM